LWSFRLAFDVGRSLPFIFSTISPLTAGNCSIIAQWLGSVDQWHILADRTSIRPLPADWCTGNKKEATNYRLIIKNACAHRINPNASIALPFVPLMLLIAYQCSVSIELGNWIGGGGGSTNGRSRIWIQIPYQLQFIRVSLTSPVVYRHRLPLACW